MRKPKFSRQDSHKKVKLGDKWRKPKGIDSKMRLHLHGYKVSPSPGYGRPRKDMDADYTGKVPLLVSALAELEGKEYVTIAASVGLRKKIELVKACIEKKIRISNVRDPKRFLENTAKDIEEKKKEKKKKQEAKKEKEKEKEKKAKEKETKEKETEKKESLEELASDEEKKKEEKKEKDKLLTKKDAGY